MLFAGWLFYGILFSTIILFLPLQSFGGTTGMLITLFFFLLGGIDLLASNVFKMRRG